MSEIAQYKIVVLGESSVGKTSFITRFAEDSFTDNFIATIGVDYRMKTLTRNERKVKLQIWDTAGQERYRAVAKGLYNNTDGILLLYDISERETFDKISSWLSEIKSKGSYDALVILIGNKCDLPVENRKVTEEEGKSLAKMQNIPFFEASAKASINITKIMDYTADRLMTKVKKIETRELVSAKTTVVNSSSSNKQKSLC